MGEENKVEVPTGTTHSPVPGEEKVESNTLSFYDALKFVMDGQKMTKKEWADKEYYGILDNTHLKLHKPDGKMYDWILNDGDIAGTDWEIISS